MRVSEVAITPKDEPMPFETILFDITDSVATLTLNRPDKLNAFTSGMHVELREAMDRVRSTQGVRVLLLTGAGRGFCAGQDLTERAMAEGRAPVDLGSTLEANYNPLIRGLRELPIPVVCAVNGVAAGAGCNLALAGDIVLAARSASFLQAFSRIGLIPDAGGTWILPRTVGLARAMALAMLADKISAEQAQAWGMIWKCVDDAQLAARSQAAMHRTRIRPNQGLRPNQAGLVCVVGERPGGAARSGSAPSARGGQEPRFPGGSDGVLGKTAGEVHGGLIPLEP